MTTITSTNPTTGTTGSTTLPGVTMATGAAGQMNENDFLKLMTTQLSTQDPFNPVDNTQMVAQMAQFSQLAGISEMNQSLATMAQAFAPGRLRSPRNSEQRTSPAPLLVPGLGRRRLTPRWPRTLLPDLS